MSCQKRINVWDQLVPDTFKDTSAQISFRNLEKMYIWTFLVDKRTREMAFADNKCFVSGNIVQNKPNMLQDESLSFFYDPSEQYSLENKDINNKRLAEVIFFFF